MLLGIKLTSARPKFGGVIMVYKNTFRIFGVQLLQLRAFPPKGCTKDFAALWGRD